MVYILIIFAALSGCTEQSCLNPSEKLTAIPVIDIIIAHEDYSNLLSNKKVKYKVFCKLHFMGKEYSGTIKASGAGSKSHSKWSYSISLDNGSIFGARNFILSSQIYDKTSIKTVLMLYIFKLAGFNTFNSNHIFLRINSRDIGLYPMLEKVDSDFFAARNLTVFELYKAGFESKLSFAKMNYPEFHFDRDIPNNDDYSSLYRLIQCIDSCNPENLFNGLGKFIDIENYLKYHAISSISNNEGAFENNYYLYKEADGKPFKMIPWDFDETFGPVDEIAFYGDNDIIRKLFQCDSARKMYLTFCIYYLEHIIREDLLFPVIDSVAATIADAYLLDKYLGGISELSAEVRQLKQNITSSRIYFLKKINSNSIK